MTTTRIPSAPAETDTPPAADDTRRRGAVRLAFAAVCALWVAQVLSLGGGAGEPYPSILMPSFAGSGGYADSVVRIERMQPVFVGPGVERPVTQRALLADVPDSHHGTLSGLLHPTGRAPRPLQRWLRAHLLPGLAAGGLRNRAGCPDVSLRAWARRRADTLLPGVPVQRLELRWYMDTFSGGAATPSARARTGTLVIPFAEEGPCAP
ncbi:hypothetical protein [Longimicrobium sp.]|uniref:hypothetical protein n=1 Tax=Longimicrobium sp. TaxID=2029185 RepID=UPI002E359934|nr:hypothetical protein [Longimicrobium sp.]HEX6037552.1 hypothetical protein [Longimicrobium sp.]